MTRFNDAALHGLKQVDPAGQLRWLLEGIDPDLGFTGWLETQPSPPPGVPYLRGDCVAALYSQAQRQAPWACLVESQAQYLPRMGIWMLVYLGLIHEDLTHGPHAQDRYLMAGAILNLTETTLSDRIDWLVPQAPGRAPAPALGVQARFFVRNVRQAEDAGATLDRIEAGEVALCVLMWCPLMVGGDQPAVIEQWKQLVLREPMAHVRADIIAQAKVMAELGERLAIWTEALKEFDVKDSAVIQEWIDQGIEKGIEQERKEAAVKIRATILRVLGTRFPLTPIPEAVSSTLTRLTDLDRLANLTEDAALCPSLESFSARLVTASALSP